MVLIRALEERVHALEECCEEVQEALANKQDKMIVHFTPTENEGRYNSDKTFTEIYAAINAGSDVLGYVYTEPTEESYDAPRYFVTRIKSHYFAIDDHLDDEEEPYYEEHGKIVFSSEALNETHLPVGYKECTIFVNYDKSIKDGETYEEDEYLGIVTSDSRCYSIFYSGPVANISFTPEQLYRIFNGFRYYPITVVVSNPGVTPTGQAEEWIYRSSYIYRTISDDATWVHYCFTSPDFTSGSLVTHIIEVIQNLTTLEVTITVFDGGRTR